LNRSGFSSGGAFGRGDVSRPFEGVDIVPKARGKVWEGATGPPVQTIFVRLT
jgi:hypothetical protein